MVMEGRYY